MIRVVTRGCDEGHDEGRYEGVTRVMMRVVKMVMMRVMMRVVMRVKVRVMVRVVMRVVMRVMMRVIIWIPDPPLFERCPVPRSLALRDDLVQLGLAQRGHDHWGGGRVRTVLTVTTTATIIV